MNRREFLRRGLKLSGALLFGNGLCDAFSPLTKGCQAVAPAAQTNPTVPEPPVNRKVASSSGANPLAHHIIENHFQFRSLALRPVTRSVVVHHTGIGGDNNVTAQTIHQMHLRNGWAGIGYHFLIRKDGSIETGRPLDQIGAHAYGYNRSTVGVCLAGNFDFETPSNAQIVSASELIAFLCSVYGLTPNKRTVVGHRDLDPTDCPGNLFYPHLDALQEQAIKLM